MSTPQHSNDTLFGQTQALASFHIGGRSPTEHTLSPTTE